MKARLKDVAAKAGVAPNTASTILNRRPNSWASKETEQRVFQAAEELGYRPSRAALGLRLGSFKTIGLVIPDLHNPVYTTFADHLERNLREKGYDLILEHSRVDLEYEKHCLESILERQVDAVCYFVSDLKSHREFLRKAKTAGKEVVALTGPSDKPFDFNAVMMDFRQGVTDAVEHLIKLKHQRFAFLCALAKGQKAGDRPKVFEQMLKSRGIKARDIKFIACGHELDSAYQSFGEFLDKIGTKRPTALITVNDLTAIAAIRAAADRGLEVPEDLSVIGIDNIPFGECLRRRLTTIAQPLDRMAKVTTEMLVTRLDANGRSKPPRTKHFKAKLLLKETTAEPPESLRM